MSIVNKGIVTVCVCIVASTLGCKLRKVIELSKLLSKDEWNILNFIEERYSRRQQFPHLSTISKELKIDQVKVVDCLSNPLMQKSLTIRGIPWEFLEEDRLTPMQLAAIQCILNISDQRTIADKLRGLGINLSTYYGWKKQPHFAEVYREQSERLYGEAIPEVHQSIIKNAVDGDFKSQKLMLAIAGRWDDKKSVESLNVKFVLIKVLEVIQKHVHDKDSLEAIAREFEVILSPDQKAIT